MKKLTIGILVMCVTGCAHQHWQYRHYTHHDNWYAGKTAYHAAMHAGYECTGEFPIYYVDQEKCREERKTHHKGQSK